MGRVVPTPRRAGNPAPRADASRTMDVGSRRGSGRPLLNRAPFDGRPPLARSRPIELAGLPGGWRAAIASRVGWATRSKRRSTLRTSPMPLPQRARRTRSNTTRSTASYCRAPSATERTTHVATATRRSSPPWICWPLFQVFPEAPGPLTHAAAGRSCASRTRRARRGSRHRRGLS